MIVTTELTQLQKNIKALWLRSGQSQEVFAETHGSTQPQLSKYMSGQNEPSLRFVLNLCAHYAIDPDTFIYKPLHFNKQGEIINRPDKLAELKAIRDKAIDLLNQFYEDMVEAIREMEKKGRL